LFALSHVDRKDVEIRQTRKAGLPLCSQQLLHVGAEARTALREWAEEEGVSVNAIVVSVLEELFRRLKRSKALKEGLKLEIRAKRGFLPSEASVESEAIGSPTMREGATFPSRDLSSYRRHQSRK